MRPRQSPETLAFKAMLDTRCDFNRSQVRYKYNRRFKETQDCDANAQGPRCNRSCPSIKSTPGVVPNIIGNENSQTQLVHQQAWVRTQKANVHCMKSHLEGAFEVVSNREKKEE